MKNWKYNKYTHLDVHKGFKYTHTHMYLYIHMYIHTHIYLFRPFYQRMVNSLCIFAVYMSFFIIFLQTYRINIGFSNGKIKRCMYVHTHTHLQFMCVYIRLKFYYTPLKKVTRKNLMCVIENLYYKKYQSLYLSFNHILYILIFWVNIIL